MDKIIIASDFDGTITLIDSLFNFFETYALKEWKDVEELWENKIIGSKECLEKEFALVPNLSEELIEEYTKTIKVDPYFEDFFAFTKRIGIDFVVVSDGVDYFINKIFKNAGVSNVKIFSNHGEFINGKLVLSYPNTNPLCKKNSGTCKCSIISNLKKKYDRVYYVGDGTSDFCVADKVNKVYAKTKLANYCRENNIDYVEFENFKNLIF